MANTSNEVRPLAQTPNTVIIDAIRDEMSPAFQAVIPSATQAGIRRTFEQLGKYPGYRNSFYSALMNRIGATYVRKWNWTNPLAEFMRDKMTYGDTYQEVATGLIKAHVYDPQQEYLAQDSFGTFKVPVDSVYHTINFEHWYPATVNEAQLGLAFVSDSQTQGLGALISNIMGTAATSLERDLYLAMCQTFTEYAKAGGYWRIHSDDLVAAPTMDNAQNLLVEIGTIADEMSIMPQTRYNARHWPTVSDRNNMIMFTTPRLKNILGVKGLANTFHINEADVDTRVFPIAEENFGIQGLQGIVTTPDFFFVYNNLREVTNQKNAVSLGTNYYLHDWSTISVSPFENAALIWTGEGSKINVIDPDSVTASTPEFEVHIANYTGQTTTPTNVTRGEFVQLTATLTGTGDSAAYDTIGVKYAIGATEKPISEFTRITDTGMLIVGIDEPNVTIPVTAQATYVNPNVPEIDQKISAALDVPVVGDGVIGFSPSLIVSIALGSDTMKVTDGPKPLRIIGTMTDGRKVDVTSLASVAQFDTATASLNADGILTPKAAGTQNIQVRVIGISKTLVLTVTA